MKFLVETSELKTRLNDFILFAAKLKWKWADHESRKYDKIRLRDSLTGNQDNVQDPEDDC